MAFDLEMIRAVYAGMGSRIEAARSCCIQGFITVGKSNSS